MTKLMGASVLVLGAVLAMAGCGGGESAPIVSDTSQVESSVQQIDQTLQTISVDFTKAFLCGDREKVKGYLAVPDEIDTFRPAVYEGVTEEDIISVDCQGISDLRADQTVTASCAFQTKGAVQTFYLDIVFQQDDGQWKIVNYYLQG